MRDLITAGLRWLNDQRERHLVRQVRYQRWGVGALDQERVVPATVGRTVFRIEMGLGAIERIEARDYLISVEHLAAVGFPHRGDRIVEEVAGVRHIYEVLAPGRGPHWRWSDPDRRCLRIHTKHLASENVP